ncbi:response regulator [Undibacterium sp. TJN19]|uniref:response regulator n=1 Tax=Undibacterium sp. TJN19 TaxID=3413055 RepID=UPI003BF03F4E
MNPAPITLVTADDQQMLLTLYRVWAGESGMTVLEECKTPNAALDAYVKHKPQVLLLDIRFGTDKSGFDVVRDIIKLHPEANIVFISQYDQASYIGEAYRAGAKAFLTKNCDPETFKKAIQAASKGEKFFMPELLEKAVQLVTNPEMNPKIVLQEKNLFEVFMLLAEGLTNEEIADKLCVDKRTVSVHRQKIQDKLNISRLQEYTRMAIAHGLMEP